MSDRYEHYVTITTQEFDGRNGREESRLFVGTTDEIAAQVTSMVKYRFTSARHSGPFTVTPIGPHNIYKLKGGSHEV